jgi:hypothetical protein
MRCRSPVSRILSIPDGTVRSFLSLRRGGAPRLRGVRLIPGAERTGSPTPVLSCTARGLPCRLGCPWRGGLLLHHFTLACALAGHRRYAFCCTFRPVASRLPSLAFTRRAALWCPDFPQPELAPDCDRPGSGGAKPAPVPVEIQAFIFPKHRRKGWGVPAQSPGFGGLFGIRGLAP